MKNNYKARARSEAPGWWQDVPEGEKQMLISVIRLIASLKRNERDDVARAAQKWDVAFRGFIGEHLENQWLREVGQFFGLPLLEIKSEILVKKIEKARRVASSRRLAAALKKAESKA